MSSQTLETVSAATEGAEEFPRNQGRAPDVADGSTFAPGLRLLSPSLRGSVQRLYAVLRTLDDLVDEDQPCALRRVQAVELWARGQPADSPETRQLDELARLHPRLPREALLDFCRGMRHDISRAPIDTEEDLARYCQQAGGAVGLVLASLLGTLSGEGATKMATLGRAMQITNILRDIDEDHSRNRLYVPRTLIERFGFPSPGAREALLRDQIARADALYEQGAGGIPLLRHGRGAMAVSVALYREILRQIERDGFGSTPGRSVVPGWRRRFLIARHRVGPMPVGPSR